MEKCCQKNYELSENKLLKIKYTEDIDRGRLKYPSEKLIKILGICLNLFEAVILPEIKGNMKILYEDVLQCFIKEIIVIESSNELLCINHNSHQEFNYSKRKTDNYIKDSIIKRNLRK